MICITIYVIMAILTASIMTAMHHDKEVVAVALFIAFSLFIWWIILPFLILTKVTLLLSEKIEQRFSK